MSGYAVEPGSQTWKAIEEWAESRLQLRRNTLEGMALPPEETENCRGAIQELQELLRQARPARPIEDIAELQDAMGGSF